MRLLQFSALLFGIFLCIPAAQAASLDFYAAKKIAIANEPQLQQIEASAASFKQQSIADRQLPDPQLMVNLNNVPTDTLRVNQDPMTMLEVGVNQTFPSGNSLKYKGKQTHALSYAEFFRLQEQARALSKTVGDAWLDLYYWQKAKKIHQNILQKLEKQSMAIEAEYVNGKTSQQNLLAARMAISQLRDQILNDEQQIINFQTILARYIHQFAYQSLAEFPKLKPLPPLKQLENRLIEHPLLLADGMRVKAARNQLKASQEQYKPNYNVGLSYGFRAHHLQDQPAEDNTMKNADMASAKLSIGLPIFPKQRQTRVVKSNAQLLIAAQLAQQTDYRNLLAQLRNQYRSWKNLQQRKQLYQNRLLPQSQQNAKSALANYQNNVSNFSNLVQSENNYLSDQLAYLRIEVDQLKVENTLEYLTS